MVATLSIWPDLYYMCHCTIHDAYPFPLSLTITLFSLPFPYPFLFSLRDTHPYFMACDWIWMSMAWNTCSWSISLLTFPLRRWFVHRIVSWAFLGRLILSFTGTALTSRLSTTGWPRSVPLFLVQKFSCSVLSDWLVAPVSSLERQTFG